jgi:hypothetical protein
MALRGRFARLFEAVDVLLTPVQPFAPSSLTTFLPLGEQPGLILKLNMPGGFSEIGLPIGIPLIACLGRDGLSRRHRVATAASDRLTRSRGEPFQQSARCPALSSRSKSVTGALRSMMLWEVGPGSRPPARSPLGPLQPLRLIAIDGSCVVASPLQDPAPLWIPLCAAYFLRARTPARLASH